MLTLAIDSSHKIYLLASLRNLEFVPDWIVLGKTIFHETVPDYSGRYGVLAGHKRHGSAIRQMGKITRSTRSIVAPTGDCLPSYMPPTTGFNCLTLPAPSRAASVIFRWASTRFRFVSAAIPNCGWSTMYPTVSASSTSTRGESRPRC